MKTRIFRGARFANSGTARPLPCFLLIVMLASLAMALAGGPARAQTDRALYVWDLADELQNPLDLLDLADAHGVRHLYLAVSPTVLTMPTELAVLLDGAVARGMVCHGVLSENTWALAEKHDRGLQRVQDIITMNNTFTGPGRFAGIHIDVEVHSLPEFKAAKALLGIDPEALLTIQDLLGQWLDFVDQATLMARAETPALSVSVIATQWFMKDGSPYNLTWHGVYRNVTDHLLRISDEVVVLAYYYKPLKIAKRAQEEVAAAAAPETGRVRVGINISHKSIPTETLWAGGLAAMEEALAHIELTFAGEPGYSGTCIHMAESLRLIE